MIYEPENERNNQETDLSPEELFNEIMEMPSDSLIQKILEYSEETNIDITYLAEVFEKNKEYKEMLYVSCVEHNIIKDKEMKDILKKRLD